MCVAQAGTSRAHHALGPVLSADKRSTLALKVVHCLLLTALPPAVVLAHHLHTRCIIWQRLSGNAREYGASRTSPGAMLTDSVVRCLLSMSHVSGRLPL